MRSQQRVSLKKIPEKENFGSFIKKTNKLIRLAGISQPAHLILQGYDTISVEFPDRSIAFQFSNFLKKQSQEGCISSSWIGYRKPMKPMKPATPATPMKLVKDGGYGYDLRLWIKINLSYFNLPAVRQLLLTEDSTHSNSGEEDKQETERVKMEEDTVRRIFWVAKLPLETPSRVYLPRLPDPYSFEFNYPETAKIFMNFLKARHGEDYVAEEKVVYSTRIPSTRVRINPAYFALPQVQQILSKEVAVEKHVERLLALANLPEQPNRVRLEKSLKHYIFEFEDLKTGKTFIDFLIKQAPRGKEYLTEENIGYPGGDSLRLTINPAYFNLLPVQQLLLVEDEEIPSQESTDNRNPTREDKQVSLTNEIQQNASLACREEKQEFLPLTMETPEKPHGESNALIKERDAQHNNSPGKNGIQQSVSPHCGQRTQNDEVSCQPLTPLMQFSQTIAKIENCSIRLFFQNLYLALEEASRSHNLDTPPYLIILAHFTEEAQSYVHDTHRSAEEIQKAAENLDLKLYGSPPLAYKIKIAICAFFGALLGVVVGATIGALASGGFGGFVTAILGASTGFKIGIAVGGGAGVISGITTGVFSAKSEFTFFQHNKNSTEQMLASTVLTVLANLKEGNITPALLSK